MLKHCPVELREKLEELFNREGKEEAKLFLLSYGAYVELADDLVDEEKSDERNQQITSMAAITYSCKYWNKNGDKLLMIELINNLTYFDTVKWEKSPELWKRQHAKVLSHYAYNMLFAVIIIEFGFEVARSISAEFREYAHLRHINDPI